MVSINCYRGYGNLGTWRQNHRENGLSGDGGLPNIGAYASLIFTGGRIWLTPVCDLLNLAHRLTGRWIALKNSLPGHSSYTYAEGVCNGISCMLRLNTTKNPAFADGYDHAT